MCTEHPASFRFFRGSFAPGVTGFKFARNLKSFFHQCALACGLSCSWKSRPFKVAESLFFLYAMVLVAPKNKNRTRTFFLAFLFRPCTIFPVHSAFFSLFCGRNGFHLSRCECFAQKNPVWPLQSAPQLWLPLFNSYLVWLFVFFVYFMML